MEQAFVLGAGLGTRLRPLTNLRPKPMVPVFHEPLATHAMVACARLGVDRIAVNTHHLAECWGDFQAPGGVTVDFFHEPALLDTGGGLKNLESWAGGRPLLVHNGDILTTMPLQRLMDAHEKLGAWATLALRSDGPPKHVAVDQSGTRVVDIRGLLGCADGTHGFTGVYAVNEAFFSLIPAGVAVSVIPAFLECIRRGKLACVLMDEGLWLDLGDREAYLRAHLELDLAERIHPEAEIGAEADLHDSVISAGARIGARARLEGCVVWPGAQVAEGAVLKHCIVASEADGEHVGRDFTCYKSCSIALR